MAGNNFYFNLLGKTRKIKSKKTTEQILNSGVIFANRKVFNVLRGLIFRSRFKCTKIARSNPHENLFV